MDVVVVVVVVVVAVVVVTHTRWKSPERGSLRAR
jgi:hypothetical protein